MSIEFNRTITNLKPSMSMKYSQKAKNMRAEGIDVINLGGGEPDFPTPPQICDAAYEGMKAGNTHYTMSSGIPALRERIARKLNEENHIRCTADNILVTTGGKIAIYNTICALVNPEDEVMILEPGWVSYGPIVCAAGAKPVPVALEEENDFRITTEVLEKNVSEHTKLLLINYPNNPTGRILHEDEIPVLLQFMKAHEDVLVISDEIYEKIIYDGNKHISLACYEEVADRVITINGLSKCAAMTGWRIGYICAPQYILKPIMSLWQHMMSCTSGFLQDGAIVAFDCEDEVSEMVKSYDARRKAFLGALNEIPHVHGMMPEGAFYAWVKFDLPNMDSFEICDYMLEHAHVAGVPGEAFAIGKDKYLRFSFASAMDDLLEAAARIRKVIEKDFM